MGRLDDIVARNQKNLRGGRGGLLGAAIAEIDDPSATPAERQNRQLAWMIVGGVVLLIVVLVAVLS